MGSSIPKMFGLISKQTNKQIGCVTLAYMQGAFKECKRVLRPDGLFMASMLGGDSLHEMRVACSVAEQERDGGVSVRTSPVIHVRRPVLCCFLPIHRLARPSQKPARR